MVKYRSSVLTFEAMEKFLDNFLNKKLLPYRASEALPDNKNKLVKILVADNYDTFVTNNKKYFLFVLAYATWKPEALKERTVYLNSIKKLQEKMIIFMMAEAT